MCPSPWGFIGIGGLEGAGLGMGMGASPQQPAFIPPSIGMPASIGAMGAMGAFGAIGAIAPGLPAPVVARPASIAPIDPEVGAGSETRKFGSTSDGGPELVCVGGDAGGGMSMPPPPAWHAAIRVEETASAAAMRKTGFMGDSHFLC